MDQINQKIILLKKPGSTYPQINDVFEIKQIEQPQKSDVKDEQVIIEALYLSIDAAMRVWITGVKTYFDPVLPNDTMPSLGVGRVIYSKSTKLREGDIVSGLLKWQNYIIVNSKLVQLISSSRDNMTEQQMISYLGPLGISGLTAFTGLEHIGKPQNGETILISAAAGAVGEIAIQLAKYYYKCRVIGIAGGQDKCSYVVNNLGADACIDYKSENLPKRLQELCPEGIDIYFDNVGGEQLDAALMLIRNNSRIILCGAISQYNKGRNDQYRVKNYPRLIIKKGLMQGYIYTDYFKSFPKGLEIMNNMIKNDKIKVRYDISDGLDQAPNALQKLLLGQNYGKVVVRVQKKQPTAKL